MLGFPARAVARRYRLLLAVFVAAASTFAAVPCIAERPATPGSADVPATPLLACDPYFSVWSVGANLYDADTTHWTGKPHRLTSLVRIDGQAYRLMGAAPAAVSPLPQVASQITPTASRYRFAGAGVEIELAFVTPMLPYNVDVLSRPTVYVTYAAKATDGASHTAQVYFDAAAELTVNTPQQEVVGELMTAGELAAVKIGSREQPVLETKGDDLRIDWGYLYLAAQRGEAVSQSIGESTKLRAAFLAGDPLPAATSTDARPAEQVAGAIAWRLSEVTAEPRTCWMIAAYDDVASIEFMGHPLQPYWRRHGMDAAGLLTAASRDRDKLLRQCREFDDELTSDLVRLGGNDYAAIATLAYRQCFAAGKFVADANGQPIQFCKENHSNGCIGTSDVFYPMAPQFLLFGPTLAKSFVAPFMEYAASERWKFPFAPHDLGTYPKANGQVYGGGETSQRDQMPVEESGNMLILMAAIAQVEGDASFAQRYWPQLEQWAKYLRQEGFDPANQLCTDDFAGHLAHNVNLSAKAICGLGAFAQLCERRGEAKLAAEYRQVAEEFAQRWIEQADDGECFRLAFDKPGTWSQKYNLVWDRVLGLNLFPDAVLAKEMAFYRRRQNQFGLPLDSRKTYTKLDWILWTATLTRSEEDFAALVGPVREFLADTPDRSPMTDWYETESGKKVGFTARPVVGGVFMRMLHDRPLWQKWADRDVTRATDYAALPQLPKVLMQVSAADSAPAMWRFCTEAPQGEWFAADYDDAAWQEGPGGFGTPHTPGARIGTVWSTPQIWLRRIFDLDCDVNDALRLHVHHDEDADIYLNGVLARSVRGYTGDYEQLRIRPEALKTLQAKGNVLAVYCRQTTGGQYIDIGVARVEEKVR